MPTIAHNLKQINAQIRAAEQIYHRVENSVQLLAVSKTKPASAVASAYQAGQRHFGENYVQEALSKQLELGAFDITWHFIGAIQSNKTKVLATHFDWIHCVDSLKIAQRLSSQRPKFLSPLNICVQVNISDETSKSGVTLDELPDLISQISELPNLILRGVMAIPAPQTDFALQREPYQKLVAAVNALKITGLTTFSFGMSDDLDAAIAEGSTLVRIGTALFGARR
ncbi:MAG: YggS family pyridoxal phosphate-dependent enzyme [Methylococcales bacterium]|nr:YggS family pyridoxal phosphate-dependent enzyme [Methylococcales bacterium]MDD5755377.1 YggS family pyridoxal phosphate-dependent enzyme [Methylococcales bacterium]